MSEFYSYYEKNESFYADACNEIGLSIPQYLRLRESFENLFIAGMVESQEYEAMFCSDCQKKRSEVTND
jgi:hypothetical protein